MALKLNIATFDRLRGKRAGMVKELAAICGCSVSCIKTLRHRAGKAGYGSRAAGRARVEMINNWMREARRGGEMKYRPLEEGEVIRAGDQYLFQGKWGKAVCIGQKAANGSFWRRAILVNQPTNFPRLALRMSKAKSITEVRAMYKKAVGK